jgi:hypothetical protein
MPGLPGSTCFVSWTPRVLGGLSVLDALPNPDSARLVRAALDEVIEAEGPVHTDRLVRLVAGGFGLGRVSEARAAAMLRCLNSAAIKIAGEPFAWPAGIDPSSWRGFRASPGGSDRPIEQVEKREIVNAMSVLCDVSAGMTPEELKREALRVFGGKRMTANISAVLDAAVNHGLAAGRLREGTGGLLVAGI